MNCGGGVNTVRKGMKHHRGTPSGHLETVMGNQWTAEGMWQGSAARPGCEKGGHRSESVQRWESSVIEILVPSQSAHHGHLAVQRRNLTRPKQTCIPRPAMMTFANARLFAALVVDPPTSPSAFTAPPRTPDSPAIQLLRNIVSVDVIDRVQPAPVVQNALRPRSFSVPQFYNRRIVLQ